MASSPLCCLFVMLLILYGKIPDTDGKPYVQLAPKSLGPIDLYKDVEVICETLGPSTNIKWLRSTGPGGQLEEVKDEQIEVLRAGRQPDGSFLKKVKLIIKKAEEDDSGTYTCQVKLNGSVDSKSIVVKVKGPLSPEIKRFSDVRIPEGNPVNLKCVAKGVPKPNITFYRDGIKVINNTNGYVIVDKRLKLSVAKFPQHDGVYSCNVSNRFGRASATARLMVTVSPVINKSRKVIVVSQIDQLKASCNIIRSNPIPMITWEYQPWACHDAGYKCPPLATKWLKADPQYLQPNDSKPTMSSTLILPRSKVQRFHIRCFANHSYGQDVHNIEAFIDKRDASKNLKMTPPNPINKNEEETIKLICTGAAGLFTKITWYKDSKPIDINDKRITITNQGAVLEERTSILEIQKSLPSDSGQYECTAELTISRKKPISAFADVKVKNIFPPQIIFFKTNDVIEGETTSMECVVKGHPAVTVAWFRNGVLIDTTSRKLAAVSDCVSAAEGSYFELNSVTTNSIGDQKFELVICKPNWKMNNGTFTCNATNKLGTASEVRHQFVYAKPVVKMDSADKYLPFDYDFSTNCTAEGNPKPLVWWEKENEAGDFDRVTEKSASGLSWLNFTSMKENYGTYRCYASNSHGWQSKSLKFHHPVVHKSLIRDDSTETAYLITSIIAGVIILIILTLFTVILFRRKRLYGGFYVLSIPPPPDYFRQLDPTKPISEQVHKLPYFPEWEFPREKVQMKKCVGSGAFGEVYVADAIGIVDFDPRYKLSLKHKPLFSKRRFSFSYFQKGIKRASMDGNTENPKSKKGNKGKAVLVAVKKLKGKKID